MKYSKRTTSRTYRSVYQPATANYRLEAQDGKEWQVVDESSDVVAMRRRHGLRVVGGDGYTLYYTTK